MKITAVIPARGGSKGIPNKNIRLYRGIPLLAHSIKLAQQCPYITDIIVTSDSEKIREIAIDYGARAPFKRPPERSGDLSTDAEFFFHLLNWLQINEPNNVPDLFVQLRPTYPNRTIKHLQTCIDIMSSGNYDSLRTIVPIEKSPYKMYTYLPETNCIKPLFSELVNNGSVIKEPYNQARQLLPKTFLHNGYIDIVSVHCLINKQSITGQNIYGYIMDSNEIDDIDTLDDWERSEHKNN